MVRAPSVPTESGGAYLFTRRMGEWQRNATRVHANLSRARASWGPSGVNQASRPADRVGESSGPIDRRKRLGGLLNFYNRRAG